MHLQNTLWAGHRLQAKLRVKAENHAKVGLLKFESLIELHIGKDLEKDSRLYYIHCLKAKFNHSVRIVFRMSTYFGIVLSGIWSRQYFIQRATQKNKATEVSQCLCVGKIDTHEISHLADWVGRERV